MPNKTNNIDKNTRANWNWLRKLLQVHEDETDLDRLKNKIADSICKYLGFRNCEIYIFEGDQKKQINELASASYFKRQLMQDIFIKREPYQNSSTELICPLEAQDRVVGLIYFEANSPEQLGQAETELLWSFADHLARKISETQMPSHMNRASRRKFKTLSNTIFNNLRGFMEASLEKLKLLEEQNQKLEEVNKLRTELINNVSHELRTPLVSILGFSNILQRHKVSEELVNEAAQQIQSAGTRLSRMIDDLIQLSRVENRGWDLNLELLDLGDIARLSIEEFAPIYPEHQLSYEAPAEYPLIEGDRKLIRRIIDNLITNAIKYSPDGGDIRAQVSVNNKRVELSISDHGIGISHDDQPNIFERFYRAKNERTQQVPGLGLGLSICKDAVIAMSGTISCISEYGSGSRFTVSFPAATI